MNRILSASIWNNPFSIACNFYLVFFIIILRFYLICKRPIFNLQHSQIIYANNNCLFLHYCFLGALLPPAVIPAAVDAVRQVASNQSWKAKVKQVLRGAIGTQRFNWHIQYGRTYKFAKVASPINYLNHCQCFQMKPSVESWLGGQS